MRNVTVIGTGYVGLVTGTLLSEFGNKVICIDDDKEKIEMLKQNICPIYEPGLQELIIKNRDINRLEFSEDLENAVKKSEVIFITVGTPSLEDGSADLSNVFSVAGKIGEYMNGYKIIVNKSTVPIGTGKKVQRIIQNVLQARNSALSEFSIVSNPEFLREGNAVYDFKHPDKIVVGSESERAYNIMEEIYRVLYVNNTVFIKCNIETAEMIKYTNNAFLATKITFINQIANLCEKVNADVRVVAQAIGKDGRISPKFLHPGPGYGGSCFPKDVRALVHVGKELNEDVTLLEAVIELNDNQKLRMVDKIVRTMGDVNGKVISILGITFKPETDDLREAPSIVIVNKLIELGAVIRICDPEGKKRAEHYFGENYAKLCFYNNEYDILHNADAVVILTEWNIFRNLDINMVKENMRGKYFFDLKNLYDKSLIESKGMVYIGVGV